MITLFNRAELFLTYDLSRFNQVRDTLEGAGLDYIYRSKDLTSPTMWEGLCGGSSRGRTGTFGMNDGAWVEYKLYVRRKDLDWARAILRGI